MTKMRLMQLSSLGKSLMNIAHWKALRPAELGLIQFGSAPNGRKFAEANCRRLAAEGLLIRRKLPQHSGQIFVLSRSGAEVVSWWLDGKFSSGKDFGDTKNGVWSPPASWQHDLLATGLLAHLQARGWRVRPEIALRREVEIAAKHPDGLAFDPGTGASYWVEVENSEKKGKNLQHMAEAVVLAARGKPVTVYDSEQDRPVNSALLAIDRDAMDSRGYRISHLNRIERAIQLRGLKAPVQVTVAWLNKRGAGVASVDLEQKIVVPY